MGFGERPRYEVLADGLVCVREGTQMNCGGIAEVFASAVQLDTRELVVTFTRAPDVAEHHVVGEDLPSEVREAFTAGVEAAYRELAPSTGLRVDVTHALLHPVDGHPRCFAACGRRLVERWFASACT